MMTKTGSWKPRARAAMEGLILGLPLSLLLWAGIATIAIKIA